MIDLKMDEQAQVQCRWCRKPLRAVKVSQSVPLPLDVVEFLLNRHRERYPMLVVEGGDWFMAERCAGEHSGEPPPLDGSLSAAGLAGGDALHDPGTASENDREVLVRFFEETDGRNWKKKGNWGTGRSLGEWEGVRVSSSSGRVTRLILPSNRLQGRIPGELGRLTGLMYLNLKGNRLGGEIPRELTSLTGLKHLSLRGNRLHGKIPPELGEMDGLSTLFLDKNQLEGEIPPQLGKLTGLSKLYLDKNQLEGEIPPELGQLEELGQLHLNDNRLGGRIPGELGQLGRLVQLRLSNNRLEGEIPHALAGLALLKELHLDRNRLEGSIPLSKT